MTTITDLSRTMDGWVRWLRLQRAVAWVLRGLVLGLALGLVAGLIGMFDAQLLRAEFVLLVAALALLLPIIAALTAYLWPVQPLKAARYFDRVFRLNERVSTALELNLGKPGTPAGLAQKQLDDAVRAARAVQPRRMLPLRLPAREGLLALILVLLLALSWFRGDELFQAAEQARAVEQAAAAQAARIEQLLTEVENNPTLTDEQKAALSAPLEQALNGLKDNPSLEGAVSTLTGAGEKLEALSAQEAGRMSEALAQAGGQAAAQEGSPLQSVGQKLAEGNTAAAASALGNIDTSQLSQAQAQELAGQLESMAQSLSASNPQLAADLQSAAQALQNGDMAQAQQALDQAAQSMNQAGQQTALSQAASQAAQQLQQGAGQVMAAGGGAQPQAGQPAQGQQQGQQGQGQIPGQAGQMPGTGQSNGQGQPQGSGQGQSGSSPIPQNGTGGTGAGSGSVAYEQIYAPSLLGGEDGQTVTLPGTGQDGEAVGQGPTTPGQPAESLVPYQEVYSQYDQGYHQAIESGTIPFEFLETIRNYFDSLKP